MRRVVVVLAVVAALACSRPDDRPTAEIARADSTPVRVALELAMTPAQQQQGLMWRQHLDDGAGMLFVFPGAEIERTFWMKNTVIPLDMIFISRDGNADAGRIVGIHANATPFSTAPVTVGTPSAWVLEVPGGWCARVGVKSGDHVTFRGVPSP